MTTRTLLDVYATVVASDHAIVRIGGEVDLSTAPILRDILAGLTDGGVCVIEVDLESTTFLDSAGMQVLLASLRRCQYLGGGLTLHNASDIVTRMLHATRLSRLFGVPA